MAAIEAVLQNDNPSTTADGTPSSVRGTRVGQLFTADYFSELLLGGYCYNITVGSLTAGGDVSLVAGGGAGTTIDSDQPELALGVAAGYYLIPLRFNFAAQADLDADAEVCNVIFFADTTQAIAATGVTGTAATQTPLLGGGPSSPTTRAWHTVTGDITDPLMSVLLGYNTVRTADNGVAASAAVVNLTLNYNPLAPPAFVGPCSLVACWGGTAAVNALASLDYAIVPSGRLAP